MRGKVTKRAVDAMQPGARDGFIWDTELPGFGVRCTPGGVRSFVLKYPAPGGRHAESRRITLGRYGPLTVEQGRRAAVQALARVGRGEDPAAAKRERRRAAKEETVARLFEQYIMDYGRGRFKLRTLEEYERTYRLYIGPALGSVPVAAVSRREIAHLHNDLRDRPYQANRVVQLLKAFFYWLERSGLYAGANPARGIELYAERGRERFLSVEEMGRLGQALRVAETVGLPPAPEHRYRRRTSRTGSYGGGIEPASPYAVATLRFLLFTGWREREALTLKWAAVDFKRALATLDNTKSGPNVRALGAPALELLDGMKALKVRGNPYVFIGRKDGQPLDGVRRLWHAARFEAKLEGVRLHDLRHSVASFAGGSGFSLFLLGKLLGHKTARSTERYAHLADDARRAMADVVSGAIQAAVNAEPEGESADDMTPIQRGAA